MANKWKASMALAIAMAIAPIAGTFAAMQTASVTTTQVKISYCPKESISIFSDGRRMAVAEIPLTDQFKYVSLRVGSKTFSPAERGEGQMCTFDLAGIPKGSHLLTISFSESPQGKWRPYVTDMSLVWNGAQARFGGFDMLSFNITKRSEERIDDASLKVYLKQDVDPSITLLSKEITNGIPSDYYKALAIHDWVCNNIYYDYDQFESGRKTITVIGKEGYYAKYTSASSYWALLALNNRAGVCQGYASLTAALLREAGIPSMVVSGYALGVESNSWPSDITSSEYSNHAWNEAFIDGRWIIIDATWDSENAYRKGVRTNSGGIKHYRYFDASIESFSLNHCYSKGIMFGEAQKETAMSQVLKAPKLFTAMPLDPAKVLLSWEEAEGADGYEIYREDEGIPGFKKKAYTTSPQRLSMTDTGLVEMTKYSYKIRAYYIDEDTKYVSLFSRTVTVETPEIKPQYAQQ